MLKIYEWDWVGWDGWMDLWTHLCYEHRSEVLMILIDNITNIWISYNHTFDVLKCCHHAFTVTNFESDNFVGDDEPIGENQYQQLQFPFSFTSHHHFLINNLLWGWDTVASGWGRGMQVKDDISRGLLLFSNSFCFCWINFGTVSTATDKGWEVWKMTLVAEARKLPPPESRSQM